jgi:hypothetical protein
MISPHSYSRMILTDLPSPAEAGFAKAGNQRPLFGIMRPYSRMILPSRDAVRTRFFHYRLYCILS